jgi:BASS family bile acid:Na+ symporter
VLGLSDKIARTNSIEVGMQNATLGAVLAGLHFVDPLVAAPCAVSSCAQSVMGSVLAAYWRATVKEEGGGAAV